MCIFLYKILLKGMVELVFNLVFFFRVYYGKYINYFIFIDFIDFILCVFRGII